MMTHPLKPALFPHHALKAMSAPADGWGSAGGRSNSSVSNLSIALCVHTYPHMCCSTVPSFPCNAILPAIGKHREAEVCLIYAEITEDGPGALMPAAAEIVKPLYPHQQEALAWMINRENTNALPPFWEPFP